MVASERFRYSFGCLAVYGNPFWVSWKFGGEAPESEP